VLTNIEKEHMDYFKDLNHILKIYKEYILHLPKNGILITNKEDQNITKLKSKILNPKFQIKDYSLKQKEAKKLRKILKIPGDHMVSDALAALMVARILKIPDKLSFKVLSKYKGAWRRFEMRHVTCNRKHITIISDYAHHPTEIKVTLKAVREKFPDKKIWVAFQPHQYQRTYYLFDDFIRTFKKAPIDKLIIVDIFDVTGREKKKIKKKINSKKLIEAINKPWAIYLPSIKETVKYLKKHLQGKEVVIIMGAGNIYKLCDLL